MRVYKFLPKRFGLMALRERRLKIARLAELNDPHDLHPFDLSDRVHRVALTATVAELDRNKGLLCFSRHWSNPVLWAHYAEQHRGICLGFDIPDQFTKEITYLKTRESWPPHWTTREEGLRLIERVLFSKFEDWRYEEELRTWVSLDHETRVDGMYFMDFSDDRMRLAEIIVGARSATCRRELDAALPGHSADVVIKKARAALDAFAVVEDEDGLRNHDDLTFYFRRGDVMHPVEFVA